MVASTQQYPKDCFADITILFSMFYHTDLFIPKKYKNFANIKYEVSSLAHKDL
jgi:hypothetical protein